MQDIFNGLEWVKIAWSNVTTIVIIKSFKSCGISNNTDGFEDNMIHCLKPGEVAHSTAETVVKKTAQVNSAVADDDEHTSWTLMTKTLVWNWRLYNKNFLSNLTIALM